MRADHLCPVCLSSVYRSQQVTCSRGCASLWWRYDSTTRQAMIIQAEAERTRGESELIAEERRPEIERLKRELTTGAGNIPQKLMENLGKEKPSEEE